LTGKRGVAVEITIHSGQGIPRHLPESTYAGNAGSDGLFLRVRGCPADFRFDSAAEAYEIAGAILAGLHQEIQRSLDPDSGQ
jgi:hypothetical protein